MDRSGVFLHPCLAAARFRAGRFRLLQQRDRTVEVCLCAFLVPFIQKRYSGFQARIRLIYRIPIFLEQRIDRVVFHIIAEL